ncbi:hypothetical protein D5F01_LYC15438 [Larimichthys crocea]|uniref:Uncharacterized protein n=1 Tax=Larimichthys crocea TaxID=215358 RepID=A0A6G0I2W9_LARCR|nr:hypothetical protein D5F01_LYC15438 [Larimichthys crocea]
MRLVLLREKTEQDAQIPRGMGKSKHLGGHSARQRQRQIRLNISMDDLYEECVTANSLLERLTQEKETWQSKGTAERWMEVLQAADLPNIQAAVSFVLSISSSTGFVERISSFMKNKWTDVRNKCSTELIKGTSRGPASMTRAKSAMGVKPRGMSGGAAETDKVLLLRSWRSKMEIQQSATVGPVFPGIP